MTKKGLLYLKQQALKSMKEPGLRKGVIRRLDVRNSENSHSAFDEEYIDLGDFVAALQAHTSHDLSSVVKLWKAKSTRETDKKTSIGGVISSVVSPNLNIISSSSDDDLGAGHRVMNTVKKPIRKITGSVVGSALKE